MGVHSILVLLRASKWQTKWCPPGVGGGAAHIPERGDGVPFFSQGEPCPAPSTQRPAWRPMQETASRRSWGAPPCSSTCLLPAPFLQLPRVLSSQSWATGQSGIRSENTDEHLLCAP